MKRKPAEYYGYKYDIPLDEFFQFGVSVDCVIFGYKEGKVYILLIRRGAKPYEDQWALPGDLIYPKENLEDGAKRILIELTGLQDVFMEQLGAFSEVDRHTLGRVITVGYFAMNHLDKFNPKAQSWVKELSWVELTEVPQLAFDHNDIYDNALRKLRNYLKSDKPIGFELLPEKFTLLEYLNMVEYVLGEKLDKANFRKRLLAADFLVPLNERQKNVNHRPAKLYKVNQIKLFEK